MKHFFLIVACLAFTGACGVAWCQKPSAYPAKGQNPEQQGKDESACLAWAQQDSGIDPAAIAATPPQPTGPQGERLRGAARGAVGGAVIGEIVDDDAGKGAAVGATAGVLVGGRRSRQRQAAQAQQAQATQAQSMDTYYRAYGACMQGRGYTVN